MFFWIILAVACCAVGALLVYKSRDRRAGFVSAGTYLQQRRQPQLTPGTTQPAIKRRDYRAVSIRCGVGACHAARTLEGKRALPEQMPRLPLSTCRAETCRCTLKRHADRRDSENRRDLYAGLHGIQQAERDERRERGDRRQPTPEDELATFKITYR
ncbi:MAG: hypothetical protein V2J12_06640 [Gammaproteobacteria bacterium]|nr:hypothetical protein [Gammaproteobacteria bacterium]